MSLSISIVGHKQQSIQQSSSLTPIMINTIYPPISNSLLYEHKKNKSRRTESEKNIRYHKNRKQPATVK